VEYEIVELPKMNLIQSQGETREDGIQKLEEYLLQNNISPRQYFFIEAYDFKTNDVVGAMILAEVESFPNNNTEFQSATVPKGPYLSFTMPYTNLVNLMLPDSKEVQSNQEYLSNTEYRIADFPFFEFLADTNDSQVRVYIKLIKQ